MNCPKCNSANVMPVGELMWCQDCHYAEKASADPATAANPQAGIADTTAVPDFPLTPLGGSASLVQCHMCGHQISPEAVSCPSCGQPLQAVPEMSTMKVLRIIFWVIIGLVVGGILLEAIFNNIADSYIHSK